MNTLRASCVVALLLTGAVTWTATAQVRVVGTVFDSLLTSAPLADATVSLIGTTWVATADGRGRFRLDSVPPGRYQITFFHAALDQAGVAAPITAIDVPVGGEFRVNLATASAASLRRRYCPDLPDESTGAVIGRVREADSASAIVDAEVMTTWMEIVLQSGRFVSEPKSVSTRSGVNGTYVLCGAPIDVPFYLRARFGGQTTGPVEVYPHNRAVTFQHLAISLLDSAARASIDSVLDVTPSDSSIRPPGLARISGMVSDPRGKPVKGARVTVMGTNQVSIANDAGAFHLGGVPAGTQTVEVRAIGFSPSKRALDLAANATRVVTLSIERRADVLPTVQVLGNRMAGGRTGFAQRERMGLGHFRRVSMRGMMTIRSPSGRCYPNLYIDGMRSFDYWDVVDTFFLKDDVVGIEVYQGYGSIPSQFDPHNGCGSVVVWTRQ